MIDSGRGHDHVPRALCVDDDPSILSLMSRLLEPMDLVVVTADGPQRALEQFEPERFDLIITDIRMPGMN